MDWVPIILISAFFIAIKRIIAKNCLKHEHTFPVLFWVSIITATVSLFFYRRIEFILPVKTLVFLLGKALVLSVAWYMLYHVLKKLDISIVDPMTNLSPVFLVILSFFILGERLTPMQYIGILVIISSIYYLEHTNIGMVFDPFKLLRNKHTLTVFFALVLFSLSAIFDKMILQETTIFTLIFYNFLFLAIIYFMVVWKRGHLSDLHMPMVRDYHFILAIVGLGFIADVSYLYVVAMPETPISLIIPIKRLSTLVSVIVGGTFFHESKLLHKAISCSMMIIGVYFMAF